jgi:hypothetical protein
MGANPSALVHKLIAVVLYFVISESASHPCVMNANLSALYRRIVHQPLPDLLSLSLRCCNPKRIHPPVIMANPNACRMMIWDSTQHKVWRRSTGRKSILILMKPRVTGRKSVLNLMKVRVTPLEIMANLNLVGCRFGTRLSTNSSSDRRAEKAS